MGRVLAFTKRLLQIAFHNDANFAAGSLLVVSEVIVARPDLKIHVYGVDALISQGHTSKQGDDDSDEEVFQDVDKIKENATKKKKTTTVS